MSKRSENGFGEIAFREKPDIGGAFIRQVDRCNQAAIIAPDLHQGSVNQTLSMLPGKWRAWVYAQEDKYTDYEPRWVFQTWQGHRIGSKENPTLYDEEKPVRMLEDGSIDWEDPNIYSPKLDTSPPPINFQAFNELVMDAAEQAGLTWNIDLEEVDGGDTDEHVERKKTPWRAPQAEETGTR